MAAAATEEWLPPFRGCEFYLPYAEPGWLLPSPYLLAPKWQAPGTSLAKPNVET